MQVKYLKADEAAGKKAGDVGHLDFDSFQRAQEAGLVEAVNDTSEVEKKLEEPDRAEVQGSKAQPTYEMNRETASPLVDDATGGDADATGGDAPNYSAMSRAELDVEAEKRGLNPGDYRNKAEIVKALQG